VSVSTSTRGGQIADTGIGLSNHATATKVSDGTFPKSKRNPPSVDGSSDDLTTQPNRKRHKKLGPTTAKTSSPTMDRLHKLEDGKNVTESKREVRIQQSKKASHEQPLEDLPCVDTLEGPGKNGLLGDRYFPGFLTNGDLSEEWFAEFMDREPQRAPEICSVDEFCSAQVEFQRKYTAYIRLNQLIERNRVHFRSLMNALTESADEAEQVKLYDQLQNEWNVLWELSFRWDTAFKTLHEELSSTRKRLEDFAKAHGGEAMESDE